jgi:hypothetical protein
VNGRKELSVVLEVQRQLREKSDQMEQELNLRPDETISVLEPLEPPGEAL